MTEEEKIKMKECLEKFLELPIGTLKLVDELNHRRPYHGLCRYLQLKVSRKAAVVCFAKFEKLFPTSNQYLPKPGYVTPERKQLAQALLDDLCTPTESM